jgi:hypothetical protein
MSLQADVDRGLALRREIKAHQEELKLIEARLEAAGLKGDQVDLKDEEREGKQFLAAGSKQIVPVVFTADLIVKSFQANSAKHKSIDAVAQEQLRKFYLPTTTWECVTDSGKRFRKLADQILGKDGPALVTACVARDKHGIPKSAVKVEWDRAAEKGAA